MSDNPARVSFHLGGPGIMTPDKQFSIHVSRTLDCLGKSQDMVKYRVKVYKEQQRHWDILFPAVQHIIAGSKGEGLTSVFESDYDVMFVWPDVICADNTRPYTNNRNTTIFQTEKHDTPAGYTKLKLVQEGNHFLRFFESLFQYANGERYISSDFFITHAEETDIFVKDPYIKTHARSGPSLPRSNHTGTLHADKVLAFCCVCPDLLQAFISRPRPYNRPSKNVLNRISNMDAHVVPVGCKENENAYQEWRICFTQAEIHLIHNFNDIETKLYILLKMIAKLLKNISNDITSYVIKNIVLWLVELNPEYMFTEELLTERIIQALKFLKNCVEVNYLPNYMIPDRNLLDGRLEPVQRRKLTSFLSTLIREEGYLVLRCEKLQVAMMILYRKPDMAEEFRLRRDMVEKLYLLLTNMKHDKRATIGVSVQQMLLVADGMFMKVALAFFNIAFPNLQELLHQRSGLEDFIFERFTQLLS